MGLNLQPGALAMAAILFGAGPALSAAPEIGNTIAVKDKVTVEAGADTRALAKSAKVHQDEVLVTEKAASAEIELADKTKLAVGPSARIVLDKFVYDAGAEPGSISINMAKGAFRFITGASPKAAYEIKTPTVSMGVRGRVFDVYVADSGETVVLLHEGEVEMCSAANTCRRHDKAGHVVRVGLDRVLTEPLRWAGNCRVAGETVDLRGTMHYYESVRPGGGFPMMTATEPTAPAPPGAVYAVARSSQPKETE